MSLAAYGNPLQVPFYLEDYRLLPDGQGGLPLGHRAKDEVLRVGADQTLSTPVVLTATAGAKYETEYVLGDDHAYALVQESTTAFGTTTHTSRVVGFNATTLALEGAVTTVATGAAPTHYRLKYAMAGTGVVVSGPSSANDDQVVDGVVGSWGPLPAVRAAPTPRPADSLYPFPRPRNAGVEFAYATAQRFATEEQAVLAAFDFIYPYSHVMNWEYGGLVCQSGGQFRLTRMVTDRMQDRVPSLSTMTCGALGTAVARFHTHPPKENPDPSGPDLDTAETHAPMFNYVRSRLPQSSIDSVPPAPSQTLRFRKLLEPESPSPRDNTCVLRMGSWVPYWVWTTTCR